MSSLDRNIDTDFRALRRIAQIVKNYSKTQCELIQNYLKVMCELESEIETEGYRQQLDEILHFSRQMELLKLNGLAFAVFLMNKADQLEMQQGASGSVALPTFHSGTGSYASMPCSTVSNPVSSSSVYPRPAYYRTEGYISTPAVPHGTYKPVTAHETATYTGNPQQICRLSGQNDFKEKQMENSASAKQDLDFQPDRHAQEVTAPCAGIGTFYEGNAQITPFCPNRYSKTQQSFSVSDTPDGRKVSVFDHPQESVKTAIFGQGYCVVNGKRYGGTCGLCALATILRRAGVDVQEQRVLEEAVYRGFCDDFENGQEEISFWEEKGATSVWDRKKLAQCFGMDVEILYEEPLEVLAKKVEAGYGVIISVMAGDEMYNPYHMYDGVHGGHALVLNSVERNVHTGEITAYYVIDSNGHDPETAGIRIPADDLSEAYEYRGCVANVTADIIW